MSYVVASCLLSNVVFIILGGGCVCVCVYFFVFPVVYGGLFICTLVSKLQIAYQTFAISNSKNQAILYLKISSG